MHRVTHAAGLAVLFTLALPGLALAGDAPPPQHSLALPTDQVWALVAGALVPAVGYVLNHHAPWIDEKIKAIIQVLVAAVAGGLAQAIAAGDVGFNDVTLQFVVTAVMAALAAHKFFWLPSGLSTRLGGGTNRQT